MVGTNPFRQRSQIPSPSKRLLHLLLTSIGPAKDNAERRALQKEIGFGDRQVLAARVDISFAVTLLARYASALDRCHFLVLKDFRKFKRRTIDWGIVYSRQVPCDLLPTGDFNTLSVSNKHLPEYPKLIIPGDCGFRRRVACHQPAHSSIGYPFASQAVPLPSSRSCNRLS
jgi:hypothetical protein